MPQGPVLMLLGAVLAATAARAATVPLFSTASLDSVPGAFGVAVVACELNGDSQFFDDVIVLSTDGVFAYVQDGGGAWSESSILADGADSPLDTEFGHAVCADLTNDGLVDVLLAPSIAASDWRLLVRDGASSFDERNLGEWGLSSLTNRRQNRAVQAVDFSGDGVLDLVAASYGSGERIQAFVYDPSEDEFLPTVNSNLPPTVYGIALADFNTDGIMDLVVSGETGMYAFSYGASDWVSESPVRVTLGPGIDRGDDRRSESRRRADLGAYCRSLVAADANSDGVMDVIGGGCDGIDGNDMDQVFVFVGIRDEEGDGLTLEGVLVAGEDVSTFVTGIVVADFHHEHPFPALVLVGDGDYLYLEPTSTPLDYTVLDMPEGSDFLGGSALVEAVALMDADGDGDSDIVAVGDVFSVWINDFEPDESLVRIYINPLSVDDRAHMHGALVSVATRGQDQRTAVVGGHGPSSGGAYMPSFLVTGGATLDISVIFSSPRLLFKTAVLGNPVEGRIVALPFPRPIINSITPAAPPTVGTTITIEGKYLGSEDGQISVDIDGESCSPVSVLTAEDRVVCEMDPGVGASLAVDYTALDIAPTEAPEISYAAPSVLRIEPAEISEASLASLSRVSIIGENFGGSPSTLDQVQFSGGQATCSSVEIRQEHSVIRCALDLSGAVTVEADLIPEIVVGGQSLDPVPEARLTVVPPATFSRLVPPGGAPGTLVTIIGTNFIDNPEMRCRVSQADGGSVEAVYSPSDDAFFISRTEVACRVPPTSTIGTSVNFDLSFDRGDTYLAADPGARAGVVTDELSVTQAFPEQIPARVEPTEVYVLGEGFLESERFQCVIDGRFFFDANVISVQVVQCLVSWTTQGGVFPITVTNDGVLPDGGNGGITRDEVTISIFDTPTMLLIVQQPPAEVNSGEPLSSPPAVQVTDSNAANVDDFDVTVFVTVDPPLQLSGAQADTVDGVATFPDLVLIGEQGQTYQMTFATTDGALQPAVSDPFVILTCDQLLENSEQEPGGLECVCSPGFQFSPGDEDAGTEDECLPCRAGTYKTIAGNDECTECPVPEMTTLGVGASSLAECACIPGYFRESLSDVVCTPCLPGAICPGEDQIYAADGFWRPATNSTAFFECPNPDACRGGVNATCTTGYEDVLCSVCSKGYGSLGTLCTKCPDSSGVNGFLAALTLCFFLFVGYIIVRAARFPTRPASVTFKIFVSYLQVILYLGDYTISWPSSVLSMFQIGNLVVFSTDLATVDCSFQLSYSTRVLLVWLSPVFIVVAVVAVYTIKHVVQKVTGTAGIGESWRSKVKDVQLAVMALLFVIHSAILRDTLFVFRCESYGGTERLYADRTINCKSDSYQALRGVAFLYLFGYVFTLIGVIAFRLRRNHAAGKLLDASSTAEFKYRFLTGGYLPAYYYWELVVLARKCLVVAVSVFFSADYQIYWGVVLLVLSLQLHTAYQPFATKMLTQIEGLSLSACLITVMAGQQFQLFDMTPGQRTGASVIVILVNVAVMTVFCGVAARFLYRDLRGHGDGSGSLRKKTTFDDIAVTEQRESGAHNGHATSNEMNLMFA